jgi:hypothetical protein
VLSTNFHQHDAECPTGAIAPVTDRGDPSLNRAPPPLPAVRTPGASAPVPLPREILLRLPFALRSAMEILARNLPVIAGQRVQDYLQLLATGVQE